MAKDVKINIIAKDKGSKTFKKFSDNTTSALKKLAGPLALGAVVAGFTKLFNDTVNLADKFDKLNKKLGVSVETLSKMEHIANLSGVAFTIVTGSIERMQRRIGLATRGLGAAKKAFEELNIDVEELSKLNTEEQFLQLAETVMKVENPTLRAGYAFELFGMTAAELQKMLPDLRKKLSETASSMTKSQTDQFAKFADNMEKLRRSIEMLKVSVFAELVEELNNTDWERFTKEIKDLTTGFKDLFRQIKFSLEFAKILNETMEAGPIVTFNKITELTKGYTRELKGLSAVRGLGAKDFNAIEAQITGKKLKTPPTITTTTDLPSRDVPDLYSFGDEANISAKLERESQAYRDALKLAEENREKMKTFHGQQTADKQKFNTMIYEMDKTAADLKRESIDADYEYMLELGIKEVDAAKWKADEIKKIENKAAKDAEDATKKKFQTAAKYLSDMSGLMSSFNTLFTTLSTASGKQSKKDWKRQKSLSRAQTIVNTAAGVTKVLADPGGYLGMALGVIVAATGAAQLATINKTKYTYAKGGAFTNSIVNQPTPFDNSLMGEAGPEAILPLTKTSSGELGVKSSGDQQPINNYYYSVQAMDSKSFTDYVRRNPSAITTVIGDEIQKGNSSLNSNIRRASM